MLTFAGVSDRGDDFRPLERDRDRERDRSDWPTTTGTSICSVLSAGAAAGADCCDRFSGCMSMATCDAAAVL